ncbi:MAG: hypothetical protein RL653_4181, partial [Pseudomonadota bacterium]
QASSSPGASPNVVNASHAAITAANTARARLLSKKDVATVLAQRVTR